jgi:hypothetical protein
LKKKVEEGELKVMLSAESSVTDASMIENIEIIWSAFNFYNISYPTVQKAGLHILCFITLHDDTFPNK